MKERRVFRLADPGRYRRALVGNGHVHGDADPAELGPVTAASALGLAVGQVLEI